MAQTTINNGDTGATVRAALNTMFGELYASGYYIEVANYSALPAAADHTGEIYVCLADEGTWILGTKKAAGLWYSNGSTWSRLGPALNAAAIYFSAAGGVAGTDVQAAIEELDTEKVNISGGTINGQRDTRTDLSPADGATATLDCSLGNAFKITAPDTGAGMDFTIALSSVPTGTVYHAIEVAIVVGTNIPTISYTGKGTNVTAPTLVASRTNIIIVSTWDNGTTLMLNSAGTY